MQGYYRHNKNNNKLMLSETDSIFAKHANRY